MSPASVCNTGQSDGKKVKDRSGRVSVGQQRQVGRLCARRRQNVGLIHRRASSSCLFFALEQLDHGLSRLPHSDPFD